MQRALSVPKLEQLSHQLRRQILGTIYQTKVGHLAGSLSSLEILVSLYFGGILRYDPRRPNWPERDRLIVSAGHLAPAIYTVLAAAKFFPKRQLQRFGLLRSRFETHTVKRVPGIEYSAGLLGQGLSVAIGLALALQNNRSRIFCLMSDGEQQEGQVWEAAMAASKYRLGNLVGIIDANQIQIDGHIRDIMPLANLKLKYEAFGWRVFETDGNDFRRLVPAFSQALESRHQPAVIIAKTVAAAGIPSMENNPYWHSHIPNSQEYQQALKDLRQGL